MEPQDPIQPEWGPPALATTPAAVEPPSRHGTRRTVVVVVLSALILLAVGGGAAAFVLMRGGGEVLLTKIPSNTDVTAVINLDPSAGQKVNLLRMAHQFPALASSQKISGEVNDTLDRMLAGVGLDHNDLSWVGSEVAVTVDLKGTNKPDVGLLIATSDESAARASLQKIRNGTAGQKLTWTTEDHGGVQVSVGTAPSGMGVAYAVTDGVVAIGDDKQVVEGVIDADQKKVSNLAESGDFNQTMSDLPAARLGFLYVGPGVMQDAAASSSALQLGSVGTGVTDLKAIEGVGVTVSAQPDGLAIDSSVRYNASLLSPASRALMLAARHANPLLQQVPADAFVVVSEEHVDATLKTAIAQLGSQGSAQAPAAAQLSGLLQILTGDLAIEAGPGGLGAPGAAILIGTKDGAAMSATLDSLAAFLPSAMFSQTHARWTTERYHGVTIRSLVIPGNAVGIAPSYAVVHGAGVISTSAAALHAVIDASAGSANITSTPGFTSAVGSVPDGGTLVYVDVAGLIGSLGGALPGASPLDNLKPIRSIAVGSNADATHQRVGVFVRIP